MPAPQHHHAICPSWSCPVPVPVQVPVLSPLRPLRWCCSDKRTAETLVVGMVLMLVARLRAAGTGMNQADRGIRQVVAARRFVVVGLAWLREVYKEHIRYDLIQRSAHPPQERRGASRAARARTVRLFSVQRRWYGRMRNGSSVCCVTLLFPHCCMFNAPRRNANGMVSQSSPVRVGNWSHAHAEMPRARRQRSLKMRCRCSEENVRNASRARRRQCAARNNGNAMR